MGREKEEEEEVERGEHHNMGREQEEEVVRGEHHHGEGEGGSIDYSTHQRCAASPAQSV